MLPVVFYWDLFGSIFLFSAFIFKHSYCCTRIFTSWEVGDA